MGTNPSAQIAQTPFPQPKKETAMEHVGKGYELIKDERYREAAAELQAAVVMNPHLASARYQLAICLFACKERHRMILVFCTIWAESIS
jgi:hypothetical protein